MQGDSPKTAVGSERLSLYASFAGLALVLFFAAFFFIWRPFSVPGPMMRDLEAYYAAGATWDAGGDPYSTQIWNVERTIPGVDARREEVLPFLGPPVSLPFWALLARLPFVGAVVVWSTVLAAAVAMLFLGAFALAGRPANWRDVPIVFALAASFSPLTYGFSLGQAALPAMGAMIAALLLLRTKRWPWSVIASFGAVVLKPNVMLVLLGLLRTRRGFLSLATLAGVFIAANLAIAGGPAGLLRYEQALRGQTLAERWSFLQVTPASIAFGFGFPGPVASGIGSVVALVALAVLVYFVLRTRTDDVETAALGCATIPFVSPFLHVHDLIVVFLPAMLCIQRARGRVWAAAAVGTVLVSTDWVAMTQGKIGGLYDFIIALVAACEIIALAPRVRLPFRLAPLAVAALVIPIWAAAPSTAMTLWPQGLPFAFRAPLDQPVSAVWKAEQVATGLERTDPFEALVRSLSLVGCALIGGALTVTLFDAKRTALRDVSDVTAERRPKYGQRDARIPANVDG